MILILSLLDLCSALALFLTLCVSGYARVDLFGVSFLLLLVRLVLGAITYGEREITRTIQFVRGMADRLELPIVLAALFFFIIMREESVPVLWALRVLFGILVLERTLHMALCLILDETEAVALYRDHGVTFSWSDKDKAYVAISDRGAMVNGTSRRSAHKALRKALKATHGL